MKNTALLEEIEKITSILDVHLERLMKNPGQLHEIDIDLMSGKLKEIYALVHELQSETEPEPEAVLNSEEENKIIEEKPIETETAKVSDPEVEPKLKAEKRPEEKEPPVPEVKTTADLFSGSATIADSFQEGEDKSVAANMIHQPVQDLKMAIGINDKFLFINELFGGSPSDYNEAIEKLNLAEGLPEAENTLADYETQHKWDGNSEASNRLKKLIEKKFN
jgi:hypothetical protein